MDVAETGPASDSALRVSVASKFSYQGQLSDAGGAPLSGDYVMQFRLYDAAEDGSLLWDSGKQIVAVTNGLFNVELTPAPGVVNGQALWLEVVVAGEPLPRQEILPVPYAMSLISGAVLSGSGDDAILTVSNLDGPAIVATIGGSSATGSHATSMEASATALTNGRSGAVAGHSETAVPGVFGTSSAGGIGVLGHADGEDSTGVAGQGDSIGVEGLSASGIGVYGGSVSGNAGVFKGNVKINGELNVNDGKIRLDNDGEIYANSFHGPKTTPQTEVVAGVMPADDYVFSMDSSGNAEFVTVVAQAMIAIDVTVQDQFKVKLPFGDQENRLSDSGLEFIDAAQTVVGTWSSVDGNLSTRGDLTAQGTKNAVVETENNGRRKLYTEEATEVYFIDRGQGQLMDGTVTIALDPLFLETVTIDAEHPMLVQITLTGDCNGVFVAEQTSTSFTVRELMGGISAATFNWEVAAKRRGYENDRLEPYTPEVER